MSLLFFALQAYSELVSILKKELPSPNPVRA
jgi:hypothetical protein